MIVSFTDVREQMNTVYVTDFGDNYHVDYDGITTEDDKEARGIRRRYKDPIEFLHAEAVYKKFMSSIYEKYPSKKLAKDAIREGYYQGFIPPRPTMKTKSDVYKWLQHGEVLSRIDMRKFKDFDDIREELQANTPRLDEPVVIGSVMGDKSYNAIAKGVKFNKRRLNKTTIPAASVTDMDLIQAYFEKTHNRKGEIDDYVDTSSRGDVIGIAILLDDERYEELISDDPSDEVVYHNGRYMKVSERDSTRIYDTLEELGYDSIKIMKSKGAATRSASRVTKLAQKRMKSLRKSEKKRKKALAKMGGISGSFDDYESEMLDFTFR